MGGGSASKQGAFSVGVGQRGHLHLGSFTQLEEADGLSGPTPLDSGGAVMKTATHVVTLPLQVGIQ